MNTYEKSMIFLRAWLIGQKYYDASRMLELCIEKHGGLRKDGVTPNYVHPITVCQYLRTLHGSLISPEATYCVALGHDLIEDTDITREYLVNNFGEEIGTAIFLLTKFFNSSFEDYKERMEEYFFHMSSNPIASIVKGSDRVENNGNIAEVFTIAKQISYISETKNYILPMLKVARRSFPQQEGVYENIKWMLNSQNNLLMGAINYEANLLRRDYKC